MISLFYKIFSLFMALLTSMGMFHNTSKTYSVYNDVRYGDAERNLMDIYVPESAFKNENNGCILFIHGGSWTGGNKEEMKNDCITYAEKGYITATMSYTLYTEGGSCTAFTMVDEIGLAIERIRIFSEENNLNISKIATSGYSAGAHISALYAYTKAEESSIPLAFTANRVGPSDFHSSSWDNAYGNGMGLSLAFMLSGYPVPESSDGKSLDETDYEDIINSVSPAYFINENSVPTIAAYGGRDTIVPAGNAASTKNALEKSGIDYIYILYPNSNHLLSSDYTEAIEYENAVTDFCSKYFGY